MEGIATLIEPFSGKRLRIEDWRKKTVSDTDCTLFLPLSLKGLSLAIRFSARWHRFSTCAKIPNPLHRLKTCATNSLLNQPLTHLGLMLSPQGRGK